MTSTPNPKLAAVIGWPIGHSLSPSIHHFWAEREGVNAYYVPIGVEPDYESFKRAIDGLRAANFAGVNVTAPHKEHALQYADEASEIAASAGAANMLTFGERVVADNSDASGFLAPLKVVLSDRTDVSIFILGAGGAARGILAGLFTQYKDIKITNRSREKAEVLATKYDLQIVDWTKKEDQVEAADVVINTTTLGSEGAPSLGLDPTLFRPEMIACDIIYNPLQTSFLRDAAKKECCTIDGLAMLMHQAIPGYQAWLGEKAKVDQHLREHLLNILAARNRP